MFIIEGLGLGRTLRLKFGLTLALNLTPTPMSIVYNNANQYIN